MRIWDVNPGYLNRQSLLGEHRELHGIYIILKAAQDQNLGPVDSIETNAFWATDEKIITERLKKLDKLGMSKLKNPYCLPKCIKFSHYIPLISLYCIKCTHPLKLKPEMMMKDDVFPKLQPKPVVTTTMRLV